MLHLTNIFWVFLLFFFSVILTKPLDIPVIAILANPNPYNSQNITSSRVNSQYVRWLEQSFSEVVVIQPWHTEEEIEEILEKVNGVLWPGGDRDLKLCGEFEQKAILILKKIIKLYDEKKVRLPLWGTCQGFEMIAAFLSNTVGVLTNFDSWDVKLPVIFKEPKQNSFLSGSAFSEMYKDFSKGELDALRSENVTAHYHNLGISEDNFNKFNLKKILKITSYGLDVNNKEFISSFEGVKYPFYGVQYHPEMIAYKKIKMRGIPRTMNAVKISQKLSDFFLNQARMNDHRMDAEDIKRYKYIDFNLNNLIYEGGSHYYIFGKDESS
jgi:gamma-glutamyl hydrolase